MKTVENFNKVLERLRAKIKLVSGWDEYNPGVKPKPRPGGETSDEHLLWMLDEAQAKYTIEDAESCHRSLGFVQGIMVAKGYTTVSIERELTRGLL